MALIGVGFLVVLLQSRQCPEDNFAVEALEMMHRSIMLVPAFQSFEDPVAIGAFIIVIDFVMRSKPGGSSEGDLAGVAWKGVVDVVVRLQRVLGREDKFTFEADPGWLMSSVPAMIVDRFETAEPLLAGVALIIHDERHREHADQRKLA
jgi:hypothetical protein